MKSQTLKEIETLLLEPSTKGYPILSVEGISLHTDGTSEQRCSNNLTRLIPLPQKFIPSFFLTEIV